MQVVLEKLNLQALNEVEMKVHNRRNRIFNSLEIRLIGLFRTIVQFS
jgi:hypothetical protein